MINFKGTNRQLLNLYRGLEGVKDIKGSRFAVLVGKNMKEIKHILNPIEEAARPSPAFQTVSIQMRDLAGSRRQRGNDTIGGGQQEPHRRASRADATSGGYARVRY